MTNDAPSRRLPISARGLRPKSRRAFTLIEMMIVLAMVSIIAIMGFPRAQRTLERTNLHGARAFIAALVSRAHYMAIVRGGTGQFTIAPDGRAWVTAPKIGAAGIDTIGTVENINSRYGVTVTAPTATTQLAFNSIGLGTATSSTMIVVTGRQSADTLTVSASGRTSP